MCSDIRQLTQQGVLRVKLGKFQKTSSVTLSHMVSDASMLHIYYISATDQLSVFCTYRKTK